VVRLPVLTLEQSRSSVNSLPNITSEGLPATIGLISLKQAPWEKMLDQSYTAKRRRAYKVSLL
jgi:hypothetical protein